MRGDNRILTLKWYQSHGLGGFENDFLKCLKNDFKNCLGHALHFHIKDDMILMRILSVLIGKQWIVQDPIRSKVTHEVAQIVLLLWMVGKHPMLHQ